MINSALKPIYNPPLPPHSAWRNIQSNSDESGPMAFSSAVRPPSTCCRFVAAPHLPAFSTRSWLTRVGFGHCL